MARGSCTGLVTASPTKVYKACKSILFTVPLIKKKEHLLTKLTHFILFHFAWLFLRRAKHTQATFT